MPKKTSNNVGTLSSFWCPPTDIVEGDVGEPVACIASTFEFDASFFETELIPRFLGLTFDHTENELTFLIEREEKLALTSTSVLVDIHKVDPGQTTLRWDQIPIAVPGAQAIQHSKIVLLVWEKLIRIIVGSANLTRTGYRRNREVFAALDFYDDDESVPKLVAEDTIGLLERILRWSRVPEATRQRTLDTLTLARNKLAGWTKTPDDFRPREKPKVRLIASFPAEGIIGPNSAIDQMTSLWGSRSVSQVTVFTPFVGKPDGAEDKVIQRLSVIPRSRDCVGWLVAPRHPAEEDDPIIRVGLPESFGRAWSNAFRSRGGVRVLALPQFVKGIDKVKRTLHSKLLSLENDEHHFLMMGSSNFTPHGMGVGVFNVEANLLFEDVADEAWNRIELPINWEEWKPADDVQWDEQYEPAEDCIDKAAMLPRFFVCASYSQVTGVLKVTLDRSVTEPGEWTIRLKGLDTEELVLFRRATSSEMTELTHTFAEDSRAASLTALLIEWQDSELQTRQARLIVSIESKDDLVASQHFAALGVDAMIDCLIHGMSLAEWQERQLNRKTLGVGLNEALDSLRSVDTSSYTLYQVRRFGRAMSGMCERMERVVLIPAAVQYRLFNDPLGPLSLAQALTTPCSGSGTFAAMSSEHRLFLLTELLLSVAQSTRRMLKSSDKTSRKWLKELIREAITNLATQVESRRDDLGASVAINLAQYVSEVLKETSDLAGQRSTEAADAS